MGIWILILSIVLHSYWKNSFVKAAAPVINNLPNSTTISDGTGVDAQLYELDVTDADGDSINCDFGTGTSPGSGSTKFSLQLSSGLNPTWSIYTVNGATYDQGSQPTYTLEIECDANTETTTSTYIVNIAANNVPVIQNLPASINVSTLTGTTGDNVFTVVGTDAENDQITYTKTCTPVTTPVCPFEIFNSGELQLTQDISSLTETGYDVEVTISDDGGSGINKILTVLFTDINNPPQIQNLGSTVSVLENIGLGETVASTVCSDNDASDTHTYTMTCTPSAGSTYFLMDSSTGVITTSTSSNINYEFLAGTTSFVCTVTCNDGRASDTETVTFDVTNVNEAPTFSQIAYSISADEGTAGTALQTSGYNITDEDNGDTNSFSIDCGSSTGYFTIDTSTGALSFSTDYDVDDGSRPTSVSCNVTVTDNGGLTSTVPLSITINNINDNAPVFAHTSYIWSITQYDTVGTTVGTAAATDADIGTFGDLVYTMDQTGLTAEYFEVDSSGVVKIKNSITGLGVGAIPTIYVIASDGGGNETRATVTVFISATTTTTSTQAPERFKTFFDDGRNIAWFTACMVILVVTAILIGWMCFSFTGGSAQGASYKFNCCRMWEEPDEPRRGRRNWGELHRKNFRPTEHFREVRRPRAYQF